MSLSNRLGLLGRKVGMMRIFTDDGDAIPVTVLDVSNNRVTQVKTQETDGYSAIQVAFGARKASRVTKPEAGHLAKAGVEAGRILKEFRVDADVAAQYQAGATVPVTLFAAGQLVDVQGTSIGKGFAGTIKRHNFGSQRASHGNSRSHNVPVIFLPGNTRPGSCAMEIEPGTWVTRPFRSRTWTSCALTKPVNCCWSAVRCRAPRTATWSCAPPSRSRSRREPTDAARAPERAGSGHRQGGSA